MINELHEAVNKGDKTEVEKLLTMDPSIIDIQKVGESSADDSLIE